MASKSAAAAPERGATRSGRLYRPQNRGHYDSLGQLRVAHKRLFGPPRLGLAGETTLEK